MSDENQLVGLEKTTPKEEDSRRFGEGITEYETRRAIEEIEAEEPIVGPRRALKQLCLSLAMSIDKGNAKGRAIANEASQLYLLMQQLVPPEETETDLSALTPELQRLFDVFSLPAQLDAAPEGHYPA